MDDADVPPPGRLRLHASCAARDDAGVLLLGPPGVGKSDLVLRLLDRGWSLVADDQVEVTPSGLAAPPPALAGLLEVRGLGLLRRNFTARVRLALAVRLARGDGERLPLPARYEIVDLPVVSMDPCSPSAPILVELALDAALGKGSFVTGAFG